MCIKRGEINFVIRKPLLLTGMVLPVVISIATISSLLVNHLGEHCSISDIIVLLIVILPCVWIFITCYDKYPRNIRVSKDEKYILFLRSFYTDQNYKFNIPIDFLKEICPVIAIGNPNEIGARINNLRYLYTTDEKWKERVSELKQKSFLNVIYLSNTEGLYWELLDMQSEKEKFLIVATDSYSYNQMMERFANHAELKEIKSLEEFPAIIWYRKEYGYQYRVGGRIEDLLWWFMMDEYLPKYGMGEIAKYLTKYRVTHKPYNIVSIEYKKNYLKQFLEGGFQEVNDRRFGIYKILFAICPYLFFHLFSILPLTGQWGLYIIAAFFQFWIMIGLTSYLSIGANAYYFFLGYLIHILIYAPVHYKFSKNGIGLFRLLYPYYSPDNLYRFIWKKPLKIITILIFVVLILLIL